MTTTVAGQLDDRTLVEQARDGDESAFDLLYERHANRAWQFAVATSGDADAAAAAVAEAFATVFTALRADRLGTDLDLSAHLLAATHNALADRAPAYEPTTFDSAGPAAVETAGVFGQLPERARAVLWLSEVARTSVRTTAAIVSLPRAGTTTLRDRARRGFRSRYLRDVLGATASPTCRRAIDRMDDHLGGRLTSKGFAKLERHTRLCDDCRDRLDRLAAIGAALSLLSVPMPENLRASARAAWTGAVTTIGSTGLSRAAERVLAGASAAAAVVSVLGAAIAGVQRTDRSDLAVAPIAPIVTELAAPRPADLDLSIDLDGSDSVAEGIGAGAQRVAAGPVDAGSAQGEDTDSGDTDGAGGDAKNGAGDGTSGGGSGGSGGDGPGSGGPGDGPGDGSTDSSPALGVGTEVGGVGVGAEVGGPGGLGAKVGPVELGDGADTSDGPVKVGGPLAPLQPVADAANDLGGALGL